MRISGSKMWLQFILQRIKLETFLFIIQKISTFDVFEHEIYREKSSTIPMNYKNSTTYFYQQNLFSITILVHKLTFFPLNPRLVWWWPYLAGPRWRTRILISTRSAYQKKKPYQKCAGKEPSHSICRINVGLLKLCCSHWWQLISNTQKDSSNRWNGYTSVYKHSRLINSVFNYPQKKLLL